jgi:hypothetical protein
LKLGFLEFWKMTKPGNEPGVITDLHDFLRWYMQATLRFPKAHRVTLGDSPTRLP